MILMMLFAVICALSTIVILTPIARQSKQDKRSSTPIVLTLAIPCVTLGMYILLGAPNVPSVPALFETDTEIIEARQSVTRELDTMREISQNPDDQTLLMRLAGIRMQQGKFDDAIALLSGAITTFPDDDMLKTQLAAAHYTKGMILIESKRFAESLKSLEKARDIAPEDTQFLDDINILIPELEKLL